MLYKAITSLSFLPLSSLLIISSFCGISKVPCFPCLWIFWNNYNSSNRMACDTHNNKNRIHSNAISIVKPTRCTISQIYFVLEQHSTCFGRSFRPLSGVQDCTCSIRYMSYRFCGCLLASSRPKLYIQHQVYVIQVLWLLARKQPSKTVHTASGICHTGSVAAC